MRTAGFPCRSFGCERAFQVVDQTSMASLHAASAARSEHEVAAHEYRHVRPPDEPSFAPFQRAKQKQAGSK